MSQNGRFEEYSLGGVNCYRNGDNSGLGCLNLQTLYRLKQSVCCPNINVELEN